MLNSSKMIREAFVKEGKTFAGRPRPWVMELMGVREGKEIPIAVLNLLRIWHWN